MGKITLNTEQGKAKEAQNELVIAKAEAAIASIDSDLDSIAAADTAELKQILGRVLQRQKRLIRFIAYRLL